MFSYDEFIAKTKLYLARAQSAEGEDERSLWQTLALEFLMRAPLAKQSAALLALPEGDSLLYAAGVEVSVQNVRSVPTKTVLERLQKVDAQFGADRVKQALSIIFLRNSELHSSTPAFATIPRSEWLPAWIDVLEELCRFLELTPDELAESDLLDEARTYRQTSLGAIRGAVIKKIEDCKKFVQALTEPEIDVRLTSLAAYLTKMTCPACSRYSLVPALGSARTLKSNYDEDYGEIRFTIVQLLTRAHCAVCGLTLDDTAQVVASGLPRLRQEELTESRYEGWKDAIDSSELEELMRDLAWGEDYGNE